MFTDLRSICSALEHFALPAVLCNLKDDSLVCQKRAGFSAIELAQARLTSLILLDESYSGIFLQDHDPEHVVRFVPCVLKKSLTNEWVPGRALRRKDWDTAGNVGSSSWGRGIRGVHPGALDLSRGREGSNQTILS